MQLSYAASGILLTTGAEIVDSNKQAKETRKRIVSGVAGRSIVVVD